LRALAGCWNEHAGQRYWRGVWLGSKGFLGRQTRGKARRVQLLCINRNGFWEGPAGRFFDFVTGQSHPGLRYQGARSCHKFRKGPVCGNKITLPKCARDLAVGSSWPALEMVSPNGSSWRNASGPVKRAAQFPPSEVAPPSCPICQDERQFVNWKGQTFVTRETLAQRHRLVWRDDCGLTGLALEPSFAIGQRAHPSIELGPATASEFSTGIFLLHTGDAQERV